MIRIRLVHQSGRLVSVESEGHAVRTRGADSAPCAAVSVTLKALGSAVVGRPEIECEGSLPRPGEFRLHVRACPTDSLEWLRGVTDVTIRTLEEVRTA